MSKSVLITGANRGLGFQVALLLATEGFRVRLGVRNLQAGEAAAQEIRKQVSGAQVTAHPVDMASPASIRALAATLMHDPLDVLFHNAGLLVPPPTHTLTAEGIELTLAVNTLGPMLLTHELQQPLLASPAARVVCVGSRLHFPDSRGVPVRFNWQDPNLHHDYHPERAYKNSKLALLWFAFELAHRWQQRVAVNAVCPGFVPVTAAENLRGFSRFLLRWVLPLFPFATSATKAAQHLAEMATRTGPTHQTGEFWADGHPIAASPDAHNPELQHRFWAWGNEQLGLPDWP